MKKVCTKTFLLLFFFAQALLIVACENPDQKASAQAIQAPTRLEMDLTTDRALWLPFNERPPSDQFANRPKPDHPGLCEEWTCPVSGVEGVRSPALDFRAATVTVPHYDEISPSNQLTVSAWVTARSFSPFSSFLIKTGDAAWSDGFGFYVLGQDLCFFVQGFLNKTCTPVVTTAELKHVVGSFDGSRLRRRRITR